MGEPSCDRSCPPCPAARSCRMSRPRLKGAARPACGRPVTRAGPHPETGSSRGQEEYRGQRRAGGANGELPDRAQALPAAALNPHGPVTWLTLGWGAQISKALHGCGGSCAKLPRQPSGTRTSPPATPRSPGGAARRSPPPRSPASCSRAPGTCSPTPSRPPALPPSHPRPAPGTARSLAGRGHQAPGELAFPHEPAQPRSMT